MKKIISIEKLGNIELYDISVKNNSNYITKGCILHNCDYHGEIGIIADNISNSNEIEITCGDRIAQMVLQKVPKIIWIPLSSKDELTPSDRGDKGFGHTGVK